jgi:hypothetical protein
VRAGKHANRSNTRQHVEPKLQFPSQRRRRKVLFFLFFFHSLSLSLSLSLPPFQSPLVTLKYPLLDQPPRQDTTRRLEGLQRHQRCLKHPNSNFRCCAVQCSALQYSAVQCSTVQYSAGPARLYEGSFFLFSPLLSSPLLSILNALPIVLYIDMQERKKEKKTLPHPTILRGGDALVTDRCLEKGRPEKDQARDTRLFGSGHASDQSFPMHEDDQKHVNPCKRR